MVGLGLGLRVRVRVRVRVGVGVGLGVYSVLLSTVVGPNALFCVMCSRIVYLVFI